MKAAAPTNGARWRQGPSISILGCRTTMLGRDGKAWLRLSPLVVHAGLEGIRSKLIVNFVFTRELLRLSALRCMPMVRRGVKGFVLVSLNPCALKPRLYLLSTGLFLCFLLRLV